MKRLAALGLLLSVQPALAAVVTFTDPCTGDLLCSPYTAPGAPLYHGGDGSDPNPVGDVLGAEVSYDILSLTVTTDPAALTVAVLTRFTPDAENDYGDLLLSTTGWQPSGSRPYDQDTAFTNRTHWNYVVGTATGQIVKDPILTLSDDLATGMSYRHGHYVGYASGGAPAGTATVTIDNPLLANVYDGTEDALGTLLTYSIPLAALGLSENALGPLALHWTTTGANDVIEAALPVPLPGGLPLLLGGLAVVRLVCRSRRG